MATPEQWPKIKEIVGAALERKPGDRESFLDQACADDRGLRAEVESLLAAHADAGALSENPWAATTLADAGGVAKILGPYRLIQILGVGGMGQVWLAEQTEPVRRRVALKLIRAGGHDKVLVKRFLSERQSLAIMDHPAIAKVFDAGATAEGQPYFAMEYVDGPPITDYCDRKKLDIRDRLKLFIQVCEGVQHAHQKAIIHRDLKPTNILVTEVDGKPVPRIIDFGLAKAVATVPGETLFTHVGAFLGTPGYMSPEQADPALHDVDTRTDVYSLGVVLYELLTGFLPFDTTQWKKQRLDEVLRHLRETDPERPSTKAGSEAATATARAEARGMEPGQLVGLLRGDLDWITLKALEKDRDRRYGTPSALAADAGNYLANRPVEARPASAGYQLRKYIRRNRVAVVVASGAAALLVAFAVMQSIELRRITRERDRADRITEFMTNMFKVSDPSEARGNSITAREILDKSAKEIDSSLAHDLEMKSQMLGTMGQVYTNLGLYTQAKQALEKSLASAHEQGTAPDAAVFRSTNTLAFVVMQQGKAADAEKLLRGAIDQERGVLRGDDRVALTSMRFLALSVDNQGRYDEAEKIQRAALATAQRTLGPEDKDTLVAMRTLADILDDEGHLPEAEKVYRDVLAIQERVVGSNDLQTLVTATNLGDLLGEAGRPAEAAAINERVVENKRRVLGPDHPYTLTAMRNLASNLYDIGKHDEGEKLLLQTVAAEKRVDGPESPRTLGAMTSLAIMLHKEGRNPEAESLWREVLTVSTRTLGPEHPRTLERMGGLAIVLSGEGKIDEAKRLFAARIEIASRKTEGQELSDAWYDYACGAAQAGRRSESLDHLRLALRHGHHDSKQIQTDLDLSVLHGDPGFEALIAELQKSAVAQNQ